MRRNRNSKPLPILENLEVFDIAEEGRGVAKSDDLVVFVQYAIPGDVVDVQLTKKKSSFAEGKAIRIVKPSDARKEPFCSHFGTCGGCKWQHFDYSQQLVYKQKQVNDNLVRLGKLEIKELIPILASEDTQYYRNKLEYTFSDRKWLTAEEMGTVDNYENMQGLGFHVPGLFDKVLDIDKCYLQPEPSNSIRLWLKDYALKNDLTFYNIKKKEGFLRNIIIRNTLIGEWMVILSVGSDSPELITPLMEAMKLVFPQITSLFYVINEKLNDTLGDLPHVLYHGKDHIVEGMEDLKFRIGPKSFFQTNSKQSLKLYEITREFAGLTGKELVYDLYTGTGTIANFVAHQAAKVVGIEYVEDAIKDAYVNSEINNITNTVFYAGDMAKVLTPEFINENGHPDVIITDPPRAGMHKDVVMQMLAVKPDRIVYVSCNSATQARDCEILKEEYEVTRSQAVDMFPQTQHVENVVLLTRRVK